ncbi:aminotransferase class III-fold pyridoxal phosphate-dependent enzyme [Aequorivita marina]|uniref:aminotransferase class III-fold pyridoxal phosphate-dependent enzyme n=1 Tax=Aequorivita marina TaxID=3073654 RepID=UPI002876C3A5|nr:aminotransferase class III-fold pyridoxal phosphate-dependent enzyme [Aequorivita sp. S2608]MDS1296973.1 aminotransferase class III-fold pyridoxal phosphate-dependent enzyme [Aequorivita sp. S2608]
MSKTTPQEASQLAKNNYNLTAKATKLEGYEDENFLLKTDDAKKFLLKITSISATKSTSDYKEQLDFQVKILEHLSHKKLGFQTSAVIAGNSGNSLVELGDNKWARLLTWIPGRLWASVNPKTESLRNNLGKAAGSLTMALQDFMPQQIKNHPAATRDLEWDLANSSWTEPHLNRFSGKQKEIIQHFQKRFSEIQPIYKNLPRSIVHNDLNDYNILVSEDLKSPRISGILDFGDTVFTQTVNDLAIVLAYATMHLPDPLTAALDVISGYNKQYRFSEAELQCLYTLVGMRLVVTVTSASIKKAEFPNDKYFIISEKPAWDLLEKWFAIDENFAHYSFRNACGYTPHPLEEDFSKWSKNNQIHLKTIFPTISCETIVNIDMSVGSTLLGNASEYSNPELAEFKLKQFRKQHPKSIVLNGYLEPRHFYATEAFKNEGNNGTQYRTIHLGTDFWVPAQTPIHAPFGGTVKIIHHNNNDKDYGPMLILEHDFETGKFYSLYGHLNLESLDILAVGQKIKQGDLIAYVGTSNENGNWAPHLHFQLVLDLLGNNENFNGVALPSEVDVWKSICPNPNFIFKEELEASSSSHNEEEQNMIRFRKDHLGKGLSLSYDEPLHIVRGEGVFLIDNKGRKYLDTVNNVNHVGHQHPKVVAAGQKQMAVLNTNTRYLHQEIITYAEALLKKLPSHLSVIHFVNSGSEANELALRMAKTVTGNKDMLAIEVGYHGNTNAVTDVSSYKFEGEGGFPKPETTHILPLPDPYRGKYSGENCGLRYANHAKEIIDSLKAENKEIAGFIGETLISCGGQIVPPKNYFNEVYKHVREAGGICIADEVQTGFGRMGKSFWAFELYDIQPDIVTMGKPAGNGHPLAIVACTKEVAEKFNTGMEYFNTFGGNPVSCAIGRAVLEVIETENLQQNALEVGGFLKSELQNLKKEFPIIGDVRGEGLFLGFELNDSNKNPLPEQASYLTNRMKQLGILMSIDGPDHNVLKIKPAMVFNKANAEALISRLKTVFGEDFMAFGFNQEPK